MNGRGKVVCVTGASGYIASWIVKLLLLRGYTVRATVRDQNDQKKTDHLLALDGAKERLKLFRATLLEEGSFEHAINGCEAVFHTASPVALTVDDPQAELVEPAVKGTLNVLKTCVKMSSVKRVIVTSSIAAVIVNESVSRPNTIVDETMFSDPSYCEEKKMWYALSKTLAEDAAWQFAKANGIDLIVMNPGLVIGPTLNPTRSFSVDVVLALIKGENPFHSKQYRFVDVRDVALAHIKALETPSANGRYILDGSVVMALNNIRKVFREFFPDVPIDDDDKNNGDLGLELMSYKVCVEKMKSLGIGFTPAETSVRDAVLSLKEKCLV